MRTPKQNWNEAMVARFWITFRQAGAHLPVLIAFEMSDLNIFETILRLNCVNFPGGRQS